MKKQIIILLAIIVLGCVFAGCGKQSVENDVNNKEVKERVIQRI